MQDEKAEVTLLRPHTHAGIDHLVGATIRVPRSLLPWLVEQGVIRSTEPAARDKSKLKES